MSYLGIKYNKGFTLIELLVVISIIGLLSSIVLASLNSARIAARDSRRVQDLNAIRTAVQLYYEDYGYYPKAGNCDWNTNCYAYSYSSSWAVLEQTLSKYIPSLPKDPNPVNCAPWTNNCHSYAYGNVGRRDYTAGVNTNLVENFDLTAQFENDSHSLRCEIKDYKFYFTKVFWCSHGRSYSKQLYEASLE